MNKTVLAVCDANVLIDIEKGSLTNEMFSLQNIKFFIPDVLFETELRKSHPHLKNSKLVQCSFSGDSIAKIFELTQLYRKVSRLDLFAFQLAKEKSAILLTGDKYLRKIAKKSQLECHGTVWLIELMITKE